MNVRNVHARLYPVPAAVIATLLESLASRNDRLWPHETWPRMKLDRPLGIGATGGHGPIRYRVTQHVPGALVEFAFTAPRGFDGRHSFEVVPVGPQDTELRHRLSMRTRGRARLWWLLAIRPLHDALLEDALTKVESELGLETHPVRWSLPVRALRWGLSV